MKKFELKLEQIEEKKISMEELTLKHYKRMLNFLTADLEDRTEEEQRIILEENIKASQELLKKFKE